MDDHARARLVRRLWSAVDQGRFDELQDALAPDACRLAVQEGDGDCHDRATIREVMQRGRDAGGMRGTLGEVTAFDGALLAGFRPAGEPPQGRPLDRGIAYMVVTLRDGRIVKLKGCADRAAAVAYASAEPR